MVPPSTLVDSLDETGVDPSADNGFHHRQVLEVIVGLEERVPREEFHKDASYTPNVAREGPAKSKYNLRGSIVPR